MARYRPDNRSHAGFSLLEVSVVVVIGLVITAIGLPRMTNVVALMKIRSSMTTVSGFFQNVRMLAVKKNGTITARYWARPDPPYSLVYYAKDAADTSSFTTSDSQIEMEAPITGYTTPTGVGAPSALTNTQLGITGTPQTGNPSFNSRGLPCVYNTSTGACPAGSAFIRYFKDNRVSGVGGWGAISITPAGRIKRWFWNGSAWTE